MVRSILFCEQKKSADESRDSGLKRKHHEKQIHYCTYFKPLNSLNQSPDRIANIKLSSRIYNCCKWINEGTEILKVLIKAKGSAKRFLLCEEGLSWHKRKVWLENELNQRKKLC